MSLQFANGTSGFKIWKEKGGSKILNATGLVANGWQKQLSRAGLAITPDDFTVGSNIAGRACPTHVFLGRNNMTATGRCLYYDNLSIQAQWLNAATGVEAQDWLTTWNRSLTGAGANPSWYEGNIKTCADKGMRLPTLYETSFPTSPSQSQYFPTDASPIFGGTPVPNNNGYGVAWTATAWFNPANPTRVHEYWLWSDTVQWNDGDSDYGPYNVKCVLP
jgi:hypothetical protein